MDYKMILLIVSMFFSLSFFILLFTKFYKINFNKITIWKLAKFSSIILLLLLIGNITLPYIYKFFWLSFAIFYLFGVFLEEFLKIYVYRYYKEKQEQDKTIKPLSFAVFFAFLFWIIESLIYIFVLKENQISISYELFLIFRIFINPLAHVYFLMVFIKIFEEKKEFKTAFLISFFVHYLFNLIAIGFGNLNLPYIGMILNFLFLILIAYYINNFFKENDKWFLKNK